MTASSSSQTLYSATAKAAGFPGGTVATTDGRLKLQLSIPEAVDGVGGPGTNPVELLAAGYASCINNVLHRIAREEGVVLSDDSSVTITASVGPRAEGGLGFSFDVRVDLPGLSEEKARELLKKAHAMNPYCNSLRQDVPRKLELSVKG